MYFISKVNFILLVMLYLICLLCFIILIKYNFKYRSYVKDSIYKDCLTGVYNRKYGDRQIWKAYTRNMTERFPLSVIMIDIDNFKSYNDTYGHVCGDWALRCIAQSMIDCIDSKEVVYRYGGEEFIILCYNKDINEVTKTASVVREAIELLFNNSENNLKRKVTVSIGIGIDTGMEKDIDTLVREADTALYNSKSEGKNCITVYKGV